jgi:hypothetical protein
VAVAICLRVTDLVSHQLPSIIIGPSTTNRIVSTFWVIA